MSHSTWDYSPILTKDVYDTRYFCAVIARCECGFPLTAVSTTEKLCDIRIKQKYREHAKTDPVRHPVPGFSEAQGNGWTSGTGASA